MRAICQKLQVLGRSHKKKKTMKKAAQKRMQLQTQATNSANTPYNSKARRLRITVVQRVSGATRWLQ